MKAFTYTSPYFGDTTLHASLNETTTWWGFLPQKPTSFTKLYDFIFFLVLEDLRGDIIHVCYWGTEHTIQALVAFRKGELGMPDLIYP